MSARIARTHPITTQIRRDQHQQRQLVGPEDPKSWDRVSRGMAPTEVCPMDDATMRLAIDKRTRPPIHHESNTT
jgi:hypothetical protein